MNIMLLDKQRVERLQFLKSIPGASNLSILFYLLDLKREKLTHKLLKKLNEKGGGEFWGSSGRTATAFLYLIARVIKPKIFVETGISSGSSSWFILEAMEKNKKGILISVDISQNVIMKNKNVIPKGWIIPENLRNRWKFIVGKSKYVLPFLLQKVEKIDVFFHDSDHSYENMMKEFEISWYYIRRGGCLISHDIDMNSSFFDFAKKHQKKPFVYGNIGFIIK